MQSRWIDELERDLGLSARLRLIANAGGQRRYVPTLATAGNSKLAGEVGADVARWLAMHFERSEIDIPSQRGFDMAEAKAALAADILDAGLTNPTRTNNDLAAAHGVTTRWVQMVRAELIADLSPRPLPLFPDEQLRGQEKG